MRGILGRQRQIRIEWQESRCTYSGYRCSHGTSRFFRRRKPAAVLRILTRATESPRGGSSHRRAGQLFPNEPFSLRLVCKTGHFAGCNPESRSKSESCYAQPTSASRHRSLSFGTAHSADKSFDGTSRVTALSKSVNSRAEPSSSGQRRTGHAPPCGAEYGVEILLLLETPTVARLGLLCPLFLWGIVGVYSSRMQTARR
jgi:hypothetical protein